MDHLQSLHLHESTEWSVYEVFLKSPPLVEEGLQTIELLDTSVWINLSVATLTLQQKEEWVNSWNSLLYLTWFWFAAGISQNYPAELFTFAIHFPQSQFLTAHHHHAFPAPTTPPSQCLSLFYSVGTVIQLLKFSFIWLNYLKKYTQWTKIRMLSIYPLWL